jgi:short-subunit dehydrogenase
MKRVVVTGATKGIGRAIAEIFAENNFHVCVCARTKKDLEQMSESWAARFPGRELLTFRADLGDSRQAQAFGARILEVWGGTDVLVNNAGLYEPGLIMNGEAETLENLMNLNLYGAYYLTRVLLPSFVARRTGHIFNMCSIASQMPYHGSSLYSITKFALLGFSRCLREELKSHGVRVTTLLPGNTWSDAWNGVELPADRIMAASDIASAVWGCYNLPGVAVAEELLLRPQLGDL